MIVRLCQCQKTAFKYTVVTFDTVKHFIPIETLFKRFTFSVYKAA